MNIGDIVYSDSNKGIRTRLVAWYNDTEQWASERYVQCAFCDASNWVGFGIWASETGNGWVASEHYPRYFQYGYCPEHAKKGMEFDSSVYQLVAVYTDGLRKKFTIKE